MESFMPLKGQVKNLSIYLQKINKQLYLLFVLFLDLRVFSNFKSSNQIKGASGGDWDGYARIRGRTAEQSV